MQFGSNGERLINIQGTFKFQHNSRFICLTIIIMKGKPSLFCFITHFYFEIFYYFKYILGVEQWKEYNKMGSLSLISGTLLN